ncbi:TraR/DksA C4-type zinc finger protein [Cohnella kolymensis]|uniref:TraR/DksA C4-type zinc finger protein n=1 Tax=Cohnella kolymensis TaxID=1590652 RepID=UPI0009E4F4F2|nr:TraR/DksA C4-type zinc finger protein [Cohnella kolymensis]
MERLQASQIELLKTRLAEEKEELERHFTVNETAAGKETISSSTGELSAYDNHPADIATEVFERERDMVIDDTIEKRLQETNEALDRIADGSYGQCVVCEEPIPFERLEALPWTSTCVEHSHTSAIVSDRPIEEQVMTPPPSGAGERRQADSGHFDEADAWKMAESHGSSDSPAMAAERDVGSYEQLSTDKADENTDNEELHIREL